MKLRIAFASAETAPTILNVFDEVVDLDEVGNPISNPPVCPEELVDVAVDELPIIEDSHLIRGLL